ncbi:Ig-like domain-containing protein [Laspinema olomoucense]|uniref:Ig-like domain-containing protein n=1 Tax=Laspinema olomoucense TaxID=3231600 RepID=UPI0021BB14DD|nr:Ig-like domain-containing protein [Laspinema sp. D3d]MCT7971026.1 Ig-like domain-containing protein [Laspinema sp. D3d]
MNPLTLTQLVSVTSATPQDRSIVIIDAAVADWQSLAASVVPGTEVVVLHPQQDGVSQIGKLLTNRSNIQAVHILSHGQPGCLFLGSVLLNADNLDSYSEILQEWKSALSDEADILLYGCNVAATQAGEAFLYRLSALTGANIAASDDLTGNEALGGDWELEKTTGAIAASLPFSPEAIRTYAGVLSGVVQFDLTSVFDRDVIINNTGGVTDPTQNGLSNSSETLVTQSFATLKAGANGNGLPDNGFFAANTYHPDLQLGYNNNNDGNNAKVLTANGQSFTFSVTPNQYSQIHLIATSSDGNAGMQVTFNYSDGTTETKTATVQDWFNNIVESFDNYYVIDGLDRNFDTTGSSASSYHDANAVAVFGFGFNINPAKTLSSITINKTSGSLTTNYLGVFGATGVVESTPPTISNLTPADNATNIAGGANLVATFSETVQKGIGNLIIKKVSDSSVVETIDVTSTNVTVTGNTVTINPINDLVEGTQYYVEIAPQAIRDLAGNNFAGITGPIPWNFTTADTTAPTISSLTPADNATNIAGGANLVATFSETVQKGTGNIVIKKVSDSSVVETIDVTSTNVTITGNTVTINPINDLVEGTQYYVEIAPEAIRDLAGNNFAGITGAIPWNFTTADTAAPTISSLTPADNATNIAGGANLVATFSETVQKGIGNIVIKKVSDDSVVETIDVTSTNVTITGNTVTINPINDLVEGTQYYVEIAPQAIRDLAGNNFAGITGAIPWNFTTADTAAPNAPAIATISGDSGIPNDSTTSDPTLIFAGTAEANSTVTLFKDGTSIGTTTADGTGNWTFDYTATTLTNGTYSFTATATDTTNNTSNPSAPFNVTVDTLAPTVTINQDPGQSDPTAATTMNFAVVFSEPVTGFDGSDITLGGTAGATIATVTPVGGDSTTYNVAVTGMTSGGTVTASVNVGAASDTAGNASTASTSSDNEVSYDNSIPTVTSIVSADANPSNAATVNYTVTFSETVTSVDANDFSLAAGSIADAAITSVTGSGNTYIVEVNTGTGDGTIQLELNDDDSIINSLSVPLGGVGIDNGSSIGQIYTIDKGGSTVTAIASTLADGSYTVGQVIPITVTFNKVLNVTGNPELSLNSGGTATYTSGSGTNTLTFNYIVAAGQNVVDLDATAFVLAGGTIKDTLGNDAALTLPAAGATSSLGGAKNIAVDTVVPTVTLATAASGTVNTPFSVNAAFSETVTGFAADDISVTNATLSNFTGSGTTYNFTVTPTGSGTVSVNVPAGGATDAAGNSSSAAAPLTLGADVTPPTVTLATTASGTVNAPFSVNAAFSETVTGFAVDDISLTNATLSNFTGTGTNYSFTVTPTGSGTVSVNVPAGAATDAAGNSSSAAAPLTLGADITPPTVTLATTASGTVNAPFSVNAAFSETVTGFAANNITVTNGTASNFTGSGTTYSFTVTPTGSGAVSVNVPAGGATDAAGNSNTAATPLTRTADTTPPSVTLASTAASTINAPFSVNATFSETVTGFAANDITVTNGTASNFTGSGSNYSFTVTPTGSGTVSVNVPTGGATDAAGNSNTAATPLTRTADTTAPLVTSVTSTVLDKKYTAGTLIPITVNFSEAVNVTGKPELSLNSRGKAVYASGSGTSSLVFNYTVGAGENTGDLDYASATALALNNGTIKDNAGNNATLSLSTPGTASSLGGVKNIVLDTSAPIVASFSPADNATNIAVGDNLVVQLSEPVQKGTGDIFIKKVSDNSVVETINVTSTNVTVSGNTVTINPVANLAQSTPYYVEIANGVIKDLAGNNYAGTQGAIAWNFTTGKSQVKNWSELDAYLKAQKINVLDAGKSVLQELIGKVYPLTVEYQNNELTLASDQEVDFSKFAVLPLVTKIGGDLTIPISQPTLTVSGLNTSTPSYKLAGKVNFEKEQDEKDGKKIPNNFLDFINEQLKIKEVGLETQIKTGAPQELSVSADLSTQKLTLLKVDPLWIELTGAKLNITAAAGTSLPTFGIGGSVSVKGYDPFQANEPELKLSGKLVLDPKSITSALQLESKEPWKNPFGLPNSEIRNLAVQVGGTYVTPWIDNVGFVGDLKFGNFDIKSAFFISSNDPKKFAVELTANNPINIVDLWAGPVGSYLINQVGKKVDLVKRAESFLKQTLDVNIVSVDGPDADTEIDPLLKLVPEDTEIADTELTQGLGINGKVTAWGKPATLSLNANPYDTSNQSLEGFLQIPEIDLGFLKLTGADGPTDKTLDFAVKVSAEEQYLKGDGKLVLFGVEVAKANVEFTPTSAKVKDFDLNLGVVALDINDLSVDINNKTASGSGSVKILGREIAGAKINADSNGLKVQGNLDLFGVLSIENAIIDVKSPTDIKIGGTAKIFGQNLANANISIQDGKLNVTGRIGIDLPLIPSISATLTITSDGTVSGSKATVRYEAGPMKGEYTLSLAPLRSVEDVLAQAADKALGATVEAITKTVDAAVNAVVSGFNSVSDGATKTWNSISSFVSDVSKFFDNAWDKLSNIFGESGNRWPALGSGADIYNGNESDNLMLGMDGNDSMYGNGGHDELNGGSNEDRIHGDGGNDRLFGEGGNDTVVGGISDDLVHGNDGNDFLEGQDGHDEVKGGRGNDKLEGGNGSDYLAGEWDNDKVYGDAGNDKLEGNDGDDELNGNDGEDLLFGGNGNDRLNGDTGNDFLKGESENDNLDGGTGNDILDGGAENDILNGGTGNDVLYSDTGNDSLSGGDGSDELHGYTGNDTLDGGNGNDVLYGQQDNDLLEGGDGDDVIYGEDNGKQGQTYNSWEQNHDTLNGGNGNDYLFGGLGNDNLNGGNNNDNLNGGDGNDTMRGDSGDDLLDGGNGNDYLHGGDGNDKLYGREGDDFLGGSHGKDYLDGGNGNDTLYSHEGDDVLEGQAGNDNLAGWTGNDILNGGEGNDSLYGEGDNDTLSGGNGSNVLDGGDGTDTADYRFSSGAVNLNLNNGNATFSGHTDRLTSIENVIGSVNNDTVVGNAGNNTLSGQAGNDILLGESGNDLLKGEEGNDEFHGWEGNDTLEGGTGNDTLFGQQGDDFVQGGDGNDALYGEGSGSPAGTSSNDTLNSGAGDDSLFGGVGNDYLDSGEGSDTIDGGDGTDTLLLAGNKENYQFTETPTGWRIVALNGDVKIVTGVENFEFKPKFIDFDLSSVFDQDVIVNYNAGATDSTQNRLSNGNETLITQSFASFKDNANGNGLPDSGFFRANAFSPNVQLGYNNTNDGNNAKVLTSNNQPFTFKVTPDKYSEIHLFATSTNSPAGMEVTFNYLSNSWGSSIIGSKVASTVTVPHWFDAIPTQSFNRYYLIDGMDLSVDTTGTKVFNANNPAIFGFGFKPDSTKTLESITIKKTSILPGTNNSFLGVFGATGVLSTPGTEKLDTQKVRNYYKSRVIDGYIANGKIFFDANLNGAFDENEPFTITNADGSFDLSLEVEKFDTNQNGELDYTEGKFILMGGMDILSGIDAATGLVMATPLTSTLDSTVVTPLTTIIAEMVQQGIDPATAETNLKAALGLPPGVDLGSYDPLEAIAQGDTQGVSVFGSMVMVQNTIVQAAKFINGASETEVPLLAYNVIGAIANQTKNGITVDLTNTETLQGILQNAIAKAAESDPTINPTAMAATATAAAQIMAQGNQIVKELVTSGGAIKDIALEITKLQAVSVGQIAVGLVELAAGTISVEEFLANNTKEAILGRMATVKVNDPTVRPEVERDLSDSEGDNPTAPESEQPPLLPQQLPSTSNSESNDSEDNSDGETKSDRNPGMLFFDADYYLAQNTDVAAAMESGSFLSAVQHFSLFGFAEGRAPSELFAKTYLTQNPDVADAVTTGGFTSGFAHFIKFGFAEGRFPSQVFQGLEMFYRSQHADAAEAIANGISVNGLEHLVTVGFAEGRDPFPAFEVLTRTFDAEYYLAQNADVAEAVQAGAFRSAMEHFVHFGMSENRQPSMAFSNNYYLMNNADVADAVSTGTFSSGYHHYMLHGMSEGRLGSATPIATLGNFDRLFLTEAGKDLLTGMDENTATSPESDSLMSDIGSDFFTLDETSWGNHSNVTNGEGELDSEAIANFNADADWLQLKEAGLLPGQNPQEGDRPDWITGVEEVPVLDQDKNAFSFV